MMYFDGTIIFNDGNPDRYKAIITIPILTGRLLKKLNGIVYHPAYKHNWADQEFYLNDDAWAKELETSFSDYMWNCEASIDGEEPDDFKTLSGEPFCGCSPCFWREALFFLVPRIIHGYNEGKISLEE